MRRVLAGWAAVLLWSGPAPALALVAVMPLEADEGVSTQCVAAVEEGVVQGVRSTNHGRVIPPREVAALGCAQPLCVANALRGRFVIHMGVGSDNVLRGDLYDAAIGGVRLSDEEPLGQDAARAGEAGQVLGLRLAAAAQDALDHEAGRTPATAAAPPTAASPTAAAQLPVGQPIGITDADHPANSASAPIAWRWLLSTTAAFGGCACLSYLGALASAAAVVLVGFLIFGTGGAGIGTLPIGAGSWVLCVLPCWPPVLAGMGCALTLATLGTVVAFLWRRLERRFGPAKDGGPDAATSAALPVPGLWMPAGFDRLEE